MYELLSYNLQCTVCNCSCYSMYGHRRTTILKLTLAHLQKGPLRVPLDVSTGRARQAQLLLLIFCCKPMCPVPRGPFIA